MQSMKFKFKPGIQVPYDRQGYIFFVSRMYRELPREKREIIDALCREIGGEEYARALYAFVCEGKSRTEIERDYFCSKSNLYRMVARYYQEFPMGI